MIGKPDIKIAVGLPVVQSINSQANTDINITIAERSDVEFAGTTKATVGLRPVFGFKVHYGGGEQLASFNSGSVNVAIPYILGASERVGGVSAAHADNDGNMNHLAKSVYNNINSVLRFSTDHLPACDAGYQVPTKFAGLPGH